MIIPEVVLFKYMESILKFIELDWNQNASNSFLTHLFGDQNFQKLKYLDQAVEIFTRDESNPRKISLNSSYNIEQILAAPTICICLSSEQSGQNEIGVGESGEPEMNDIDELNQIINSNFMRRFESNFSILCTSTAENEALIIYRTIQAAIIASMNTLMLLGLNNPKISGQEMKLQQDRVPPTVFMRSVNINCFHEIQVPQTFNVGIIRELNINEVIPSV